MAVELSIISQLCVNYLAHLTDIRDLDEITDVLRRHDFPNVQWRQLGLRLGVICNTLDTIEMVHSRDIQRCLSEVICEWTKLNYDYRSKGRPTWGMLASCVESIGEVRTAIKIREEKCH